MAPPTTVNATSFDNYVIPRVAQAPAKNSRWSTRSSSPGIATVDIPTAATSNSKQSRTSRDPRRSKDPRKRIAESNREVKEDLKRSRTPATSHPEFSNNANHDAIANLAHELTTERLNRISPGERQMMHSYIRQPNLPFEKDR